MKKMTGTLTIAIQVKGSFLPGEIWSCITRAHVLKQESKWLLVDHMTNLRISIGLYWVLTA